MYCLNAEELRSLNNNRPATKVYTRAWDLGAAKESRGNIQLRRIGEGPEAVYEICRAGLPVKFLRGYALASAELQRMGYKSAQLPHEIEYATMMAVMVETPEGYTPSRL